MDYFKGSIFLRYLEKIKQGCSDIEKNIYFTYLNSFIYRLIGRNVKLIKTGFKFSVFARLAKIEYNIPSDFFETSKTAKVVLNWGGNLKNKLINSFSASSVFFACLRALKHDFSLNSLKVGGIIIVAAISTNLALSVILQKQIILYGWVMRGLLLSVGICGLFCNANWEDIKRTSRVFNKILTKGGD